MSAANPRNERAFDLVSTPGALLLAGLLAAGLLAIGAVFAPRAAAWGWLIGFLVWSSGPIGAIVLLMIHETTGGRWGLASAPVLRLGALCALPLPIFFAVLFAGLKTLYPWAQGGAASAPDVAHFYFNVPAFAAIGFVALIGWATIGALLAVGALGLLGVSIALVFHGFAVSLVAVQWMLSIDPRYSNSAFGMEIAVQQIMLALAAIAVVQPHRSVEIADGDIGALLFATSLGAFYLGLMTFIVKWYGDQPIDAAWYLVRVHGLPVAFLVGAVLFGAIAPIIGCAWERVRASPSGLRAIGVSAVVGIFLHDLWLAGPSAPNLSAAAALLAFVAMGCVSIGLAPYFDRRLPPRIVDLRTQERVP
jgi:hypothetical protein